MRGFEPDTDPINAESAKIEKFASFGSFHAILLKISRFSYSSKKSTICSNNVRECKKKRFGSF